MSGPRWIVQIAPATGWQAVYAVRPERHQGCRLWLSPVSCWALVQQEAERAVVGLDGQLSFCDAGDNFLGYLGPSEDPGEFEEAAWRRMEEVAEL